LEKEYSLEEISKKYGVHIETVRRWVRSGTLKAHKKVGCGKGWYVYENDLAIFVALPTLWWIAPKSTLFLPLKNWEEKGGYSPFSLFMLSKVFTNANTARTSLLDIF
jgi:excisionase family DNA binding protein